MEFSIRDFAPIKEADIKLDGLTVIAGDNDTGKSTVGKLLYSCVKADRLYQREKKRQNTGKDNWPFLIGAFQAHVSMMGRRTEGSQISFGERCEGITQLSGLTVDFILNWGQSIFKDALFVESPLIWQLFDTFQGIAASKAQSDDLGEPFRIKYPFSYFDVYTRLNGSVPKASEQPNSLLESVSRIIDGQVVFESNSPFFQRGDEKYQIQSVATGIQAFGFIQRILELGIADSGQLLLLDEPEVHLHPKWQLEYARLIVDMVDQLDLTVVLTTHSPVFVEAIDLIGRNKLGSKCAVYLSKRQDDGCVMNDVTDDLEQVYKTLAQPLLRLSLLQEDA